MNNHASTRALAGVMQTIPKYWMQTYQASVRARVNGRNQVVKTEVRAMNAQDARWLLWAQYGFHSIQVGPSQVNTR
jgi:hypothetical protein